MKYILPQGPITIGTIFKVECTHKHFLHPGQISAEVICRLTDDGRREITSLDGAQIDKCYPGRFQNSKKDMFKKPFIFYFIGCSKNSDCGESEICMDEECESMACPLPIISNGKLVPTSSAIVHTSGTMICDTGYLLSNGLRVRNV